jgi:hypothetical protein
MPPVMLPTIASESVLLPAAARARAYGWRGEDSRLDGGGDYFAIEAGRTIVVRVKACDGNAENVHTYTNQSNSGALLGGYVGRHWLS